MAHVTDKPGAYILDPKTGKAAEDHNDSAMLERKKQATQKTQQNVKTGVKNENSK